MLNEIEELTNQFITQLMPERIYLFGSYASGTLYTAYKRLPPAF